MGGGLLRHDVVRIGLAATAVAAGAVSLAIVRASPDWALAGDSGALVTLELAAGAALVLAGTAAWIRRPASAFGALLVLTAIAWFVVDWTNPDTQWAIVFTSGLVSAGAFPVLAAHAALAHARTGPAPRFERAAVGAAWFGAVVVLGLLPALFFDPFANGCSDCPSNLVAISDARVTVTTLTRVGLVLGVAWALTLATLLAWRLARATPPGRRRLAPVALPAIVVLVAAALEFGHSVGRAVQSNDATDRRLWVVEAGALLALAAGATWERVRSRRTRSALARLVVDLAAAPPPGGLRDVLAAVLEDPTLELFYAGGEDGAWVDADGRPTSPAREGAEVTQLVTGGRVVAALTHRPGLLDDPGLVREIAAAARLVLDHERLRAELRAQLARLRASRARIVAAGDAERRRLERDLHDGAQQRLVALALGLRLGALQAGEDHELAAALEAAEEDLRAAVGELREVAHGLHPMALTDGGLAGALDALADRSDRVVPRRVTEERFPDSVESVAYFVIAEALRCTDAPRVVVDVAHDDGRVVVVLGTDGEPPAQLVDLEDRVGAVDGRVIVERGAAASSIRAEIPCA